MRAASSLAAAASAARLAAAAAFRSPPRFAAAPGAGASGGELRSQPRKLKFGEAATLPTAPAPSHEGRMLAPDATLPEVAAFLCDGAHNFDAEPPEAPKPTEDATLPRRALDWRGLLEARLGSASLVRRNQAEAMAAMLLGRDVEHLAPTGSGKTLVFEMDALAGELTVVVSPLQALIRSQSAALQARLDGAGAGGRVMHELSEYVEERETGEEEQHHLHELEAALRPGTLAWAIVHDKSLRAVYLTPEKLGSPVVAAALAQRAVRAYNVDEAHVLVSWGSWKPAYDKLRGRLDDIDARRDALRAKAGLPLVRPVRTLSTATASPERLAEVSQMLGLRSVHRVVCDPALFARPNLHMCVMHADPAAEQLVGAEVSNPTARAACAALRRFYDVTPDFDIDDHLGCGILYVRWAKEADQVVAAIERYFDGAVAVGSYIGHHTAKTAQGAAARRDTNAANLAAFNAGSISWLVATCVMGMGIDFDREVRAVLHIGYPPSADDYLQEIGRGGRRGGACECILYSSLATAHQALVLLATKQPNEASRDVVRRLDDFQKLLGALLVGAEDEGGCRRAAVLGAVYGPTLASACPPCYTCDRCCGKGGGTDEGLACEATAFAESRRDLHGASARLWSRLVREPCALLHCDQRRLWSGLPEPAVCSQSGCAQLVLLLLGLGVLCFEPDEGHCKAVVCARGDGAMPDALRRGPLCTHGVPPPAAAAASSADQQQALLEQLLAEVHRKERHAAALHAELEELRGECLCLAARLGRHDLLERRDVEM